MKLNNVCDGHKRVLNRGWRKTETPELEQASPLID